MLFTSDNQALTGCDNGDSDTADINRDNVWRIDTNTDRVRPVFRQSLHEKEQNSGVTFYRLKEIEPQPDYQKAWAGINIAAGVPYVLQSRQRSYGVFLGGEDDYRRIPWDELKNLCGLDINAGNYMRFVPKSAWERLENDNREKPLELPDGKCVYSGEKPIDYCFIEISRRFGADGYLFRKSPDGYRAFYISNAVTGENFLPTSGYGKVPAESEIDMMLKGIKGWNIYDRLLTDIEQAYFWNELFRIEQKDRELWNDIYGATRTLCLYGKSGTEHREYGNTNYSNRIAGCIKNLAVRGAIQY